jgi:hypothetical protein
MSALGSLANALLDASRVADLNMHVGSYLLSGSDVRFGSVPACGGYHWIFNLPTCYAGSTGRIRPCTCAPVQGIQWSGEALLLTPTSLIMPRA